MSSFDYICAVGDCSDPRAWSGIPYHFWLAAKERWGAVQPFRTDLTRHGLRRRVWNVGRLLTGRGVGGYQYGGMFLRSLESELPRDLTGKHVLSFNQTFPRAAVVAARGGRVSYYVDSPLAALFRGVDGKLPLPIRQRALEIEADNYRRAETIFVMARWARDEIVARLPEVAHKVHVVLPGANIVSPFQPVPRAGRTDGVFTMGIVGMDWKRKGLTLLVDVARRMREAGVDARIMVIGGCPDEYANLEFVRYEGKIDKRTESDRFLSLVNGCDVGCLFSEAEALGISVLEFLRCGVPVAGFLHEGLRDTLPPDAGLQFEFGASAATIAAKMVEFARDGSRQTAASARACDYASLVTWPRTVAEIDEILRTGCCRSPLMLWNA